MKANTKSSFTLPAAEVAIIKRLMKQLKAKSKVEVVRRGLQLLMEQVEGNLLREQFRSASLAVRESNAEVIKELDHLSGEGLPDED